ncbi:MAG: hypothetical protein AB7E96_06150 [Deferribacterales bacterium]
MDISSNYSSYSSLADGQMNVRGQDKSAESNPSDKSAPEAKPNKEKENTAYTIAGDRVSKATYDRYDTNGDGKVNSDEIEAYKADKSGVKTDESAESAEETAMYAGQNTQETIGANIDIYA